MNSRQISLNSIYLVDIYVDSSLVSFAAVFFTNNRFAPNRTVTDFDFMAMTLGAEFGEFLMGNTDDRDSEN